MQNVTFVDSQNQTMLALSMDVPRLGEIVALANTGYFTVISVRYYIYPNKAIVAVVMLTPATSTNAVAAHYDQLLGQAGISAK